LTKWEILAIPSVREVLASGGTILGLARVMASFKKCCCYFGINRVLKSLAAFPMAYHILVKRLDSPTCIEGLNTWSLVTLLVVLSESVREVEHVIKCLLGNASLGSSDAYCSVQDAVDCLYCVATHLLVIQDKKALPPRLHYQVIAALWRYENLVGKCPAQQAEPLPKYSMLDPLHQLTVEQLQIIGHDMKESDVVKIVAYAGTGKTSTFVKYTQVHSDMKFLAVSYNKSIQEHASKIFPSNVKCSTMHSLAWKAVGWRYSRKLEKHNLRVSDVRKNISQYCSVGYARLVMKTLQNFIASADTSLCRKHVPSYKETQENLQCIQDAKLLWSKMVDESNYSFRITHDGYLKLYQLERPTLTDYHCILVDEAQDCTAGTSSQSHLLLAI
jgi:F-box protein 18 (helicase)